MAGGTAVTVGFFDGVHLGHQALLARVREAADERALEPVAVTFDLHSLEVLHGHGPRPMLLTCDEKVATLHALGMARVELLHFTREFAAQDGATFVRRHLAGRLQAAYIAVGHDFRFGRDRACGATELAEVGAACEVRVEVLERVALDGERVSSSRARERLEAGDVRAVARLLGRPYALTGEVVVGRRLGRTIGFPTANLRLSPRKLPPRAGVYAVRVPGGPPGMMNIGVRPTLERDGAVSIEVHLFEFDGDLYGRRLTVEVLERLRDEQRFAGLEALAAQLVTDRDAARRALAEAPA